MTNERMPTHDEFDGPGSVLKEIQIISGLPNHGNSESTKPATIRPIPSIEIIEPMDPTDDFDGPHADGTDDFHPLTSETINLKNQHTK